MTAASNASVALQRCTRAGADEFHLWGLNQKEGTPEARSLFQSLIESHEINRIPPSEYGNARRRERLMKTLFAAAYARAARTAPAPPRVLLKLGAFHVYRGWNPVHGSGIGNYVAEFAEGQGVQSLHIRLAAVQGSGPNEPGSRFLQTLSGNLLQAGSTMFDLRPCGRTSTRLRARWIGMW